MQYVMPHDFAAAIVDTFEQLTGGEKISFRPSYSGRGMYGATCVGFEIDRGMEISLGIAIARAAAESEDDGSFGSPVELSEVMAQFGASADSMGMGIIAYWRNISYEPVSDGEI